MFLPFRHVTYWYWGPGSGTLVLQVKPSETFPVWDAIVTGGAKGPSLFFEYWWNELQFLRQEINFIINVYYENEKTSFIFANTRSQLYLRFAVNGSAQDRYLAVRITKTIKYRLWFSFKQDYRIFWSSFYILHGDSSGPSETWSMLQMTFSLKEKSQGSTRQPI